jgi:hypothetical protein
MVSFFPAHEGTKNRMALGDDSLLRSNPRYRIPSEADKNNYARCFYLDYFLFILFSFFFRKASGKKELANSRSKKRILAKIKVA